MLHRLTGRSIDKEWRRGWDREGFAFIRGLLSPQDLRSVTRAVDEKWEDPSAPFEIDMLTGPSAGQTFRIGGAPRSLREDAYKLNNLFALDPEIRRIALLPKLKRRIAALLGGEPLVCNSLNFERGSQQALHIDSWYMPPPVDGRMVAVSIALDPVTATNGPIAYLPASHRIPAYRFSDGRLNEIPDEAGACRAYLDAEIAARGLTPVEQRAAPGDVFIWHGQLLHGGAAITDFAKTRRSLVVHYWCAEDLSADQVKRDRYGAYLGHTLRGELAL